MSPGLKNPRLVGLYLTGVFFSGALVGAVGHRLYSTSPVIAGKPPEPPRRLTHEEARRRYMEEMTAKLKLTPEQARQFSVILDEFRARFKQTYSRVEPEMKVIQEEQRNKVRLMLNDEQRAEYEKILEEKDRLKREGRPPGSGI